MTPDQLALLADERLTGEARAIGSVIGLAGDEGLTYPDLEAVFPQASRDHLRRSIRVLERTKWVHREAGGRGHGDRFTLLAWVEAATYSGFRVAILENLNNRIPETRKLSGYSVGKPPGSKGPVVGEEVVVGGVGGDAREDFGIDEKVQGLVDREQSDVVGLRDSLLDYLAARVETDRQWGYVSAIRSWLDGSPGAPCGLHGLEALDQRKLVATALNELLQSDEIQDFRSSRGKVGEISTLRAKCEYLIRRSDRNGRERDERPDHDPVIEHQGDFPDPERHTS